MQRLILKKLASRKFWVLIAAYLVPQVESLPARYKAIILAVATPVYIVAQALVDNTAAQRSTIVRDTDADNA